VSSGDRRLGRTSSPLAQSRRVVAKELRDPGLDLGAVGGVGNCELRDGGLRIAYRPRVGDACFRRNCVTRTRTAARWVKMAT